MRAKNRIRVLGVAGLALALAACGKTFPFGEKLLPQSYGPPFGSAVKPNLPPHPHNPGTEERHAAADSAENKTFRNHDACHAALLAAVKKHGGKEADVVRISAIESIGHAAVSAPERIHEYRCSDYVLSYRAWCRTGGHGEDHAKPGADRGEAHKKPEGDECKGAGTGH